MFGICRLNELHNHKDATTEWCALLQWTLPETGYTVMADNVNWPLGVPAEVKNYTPDIIAHKNGEMFIFEIETCSTLNNLQTIRQLTAFSQAATTYLMIPTSCQDSDGENFCPLSSMRKILQDWHIPITNIGTCNHLNGLIDYGPEHRRYF